MKIHLRNALFASALAAGLAAQGGVFHVAADAAPNGDGTAARPFRNPHAAVAAARRTPGPHEIVVAPGTYAFESPLALDARDRGLTIRAAQDGAAVFSGGVPITGWRPEPGTKFWIADVPESATNGWYFRALTVDGRLAKRAEYPGGTNRLENTRKWTVRWMSSIGNGWERKPTAEDLCTMPYRAGDLPSGMDWASADVRAYHSWDDSLVRTASNDAARAVLHFRSPTRHPAGSFGNHKYVVYNVREGMKEPGQWYLDVTAGRLHYWPLDGEDMKRARVMAPRLETLLTMRKTDGITLRGITFACTAPPNRAASFGGTGLPGTLDCSSIRECTFDRLTVRTTGAIGLTVSQGTSCRVAGCEFLDTGSCAMVVRGSRMGITSNKIERAGRVFTSACGVSAGGSDILFSGNSISDIPYCGVCFGGKRHVYEGNRVRRVMTLLHDGAAFYGGGASGDCVMRGNFVSDIVPNGKGSGCSAFYFDEGAHGGIVESNRTDGVELPIHNHMARSLTIRDNVFRAKRLRIVCARCRGCSFTDNEFITGEEVSLPHPEAFTEWRGNVRRPSGDEIALPVVKRLKPRWDSLPVPYTSNAPSFDGTFSASAWPGVWGNVNRGADMLPMNCAPVWARAAHDGTNLYLAVRMALFRHEIETQEHTKNEVVFDFVKCRITGRADGTSNARKFYCGIEKEARKGFGVMELFVFAVPFADLGFEAPPTSGTKIPFNCTVRDALHGETRYWESPSPTNTLPGRLVFKTQ